MPNNDSSPYGGFHDPAEDPRASYEDHPVNQMEPEAESDFYALANSMTQLILWLNERTKGVIAGGRNGEQNQQVDKTTLRKGLLRFWVFVYCLRPDLLPGETSTTLSSKLGVSKMAFSKHVTSFRNTFHLQTRNMHGADRKANARAGRWGRKP